MKLCKLTIFPLYLVLTACSAQSPQETATLPATAVFDIDKYYKKPPGDYAANKQLILIEQKALKDKYQAARNDSSRQLILREAGKNLTKHLLSNIIPFWYGTPWNFNGYTATPGTGTIACGYFVSTTLLHGGFNLNRYLLAQQNPQHEAITINLSDSLITLTNTNRENAKKHFIDHNLPYGLYFAGLDFHVGYLLKEQDNLFFIHANYIDAAGVVIEPTESSDAFKSQNYYISQISSNQNLARKWLFNEAIKIHQAAR